jgi:hypothetical protein
MLRIHGAGRRLGDGLRRRDFLRVGTIAGLGLGLPGLAQARADGEGAARSCILLFPFGGPSQIDTFDPKPDAPEAIRGEFRPIATAVPGVQVSELFPELARLADRFTIVRSVTHGDVNHTTAGYSLLTGRVHAKASDPLGGIAARPSPDDPPHIGSIVARARGGSGGLPPFVTMPEVVRDANIHEVPGQGPGFLGGAYGPVLFEADAKAGRFPPPDVFAPPDLGSLRLDGRRSLRDRIDSALAGIESGGRLEGLDAHYRRAFGLLRSGAARRAFDLEAEPLRVRDAYGPHLFGQGCLLARRLVEAGVSLVTVYWHYEGPEDSPCWDTHENNFRHLRERLAPPADRAVSRLLLDLESRGLLDETLVVWVGEFGRSPRINPKAGREHWPRVQSAILAGAGIARGRVYGASDRIGGYPADAPVSPADLGATILERLGIPPAMELVDRIGRPFRASEGTPVTGLIG